MGRIAGWGLVALFAWAGPASALSAQSPELTELAQIRARMVQQQDHVNSIRKQISEQEIEISRAKDALGRLDNERTKKSDDLEKLQALDRAAPQLGLGQKVLQAMSERDSAVQAHEDGKVRLRGLEQKREEITAEAAKATIDVRETERKFSDLLDAIVERELAARIQRMTVTKPVTAEATVPCGDESVERCKDRAVEKAKENAATMGSVVAVETVTEVVNFQLSKDQIRSEVGATLSGVEVLEARWAGDTGRYAKIRATVTPMVPTSLRQTMKDGIRREVLAGIGGETRMTFTPLPSAPSGSATGGTPAPAVAPVAAPAAAPVVARPVERPVQPAPPPVSEPAYRPEPRPAPPPEPERRRAPRTFGGF